MSLTLRASGAGAKTFLTFLSMGAWLQCPTAMDGGSAAFAGAKSGQAADISPMLHPPSANQFSGLIMSNDRQKIVSAVRFSGVVKDGQADYTSG